MTEKLELYKCEICGNIVEVVIDGAGTLVCCGENMKNISPKTDDSIGEKHVPAIERENGEMTIRIGKVPHPMTEEHYIQFIEAISDDHKYLKRKYLYPNEEPILKFKCKCEEKIKSREYCNIHGLWASEEK